jgi:hypothetical protein
MNMGTQEWVLLGLVLVLPLVVAVAVTLWTLEQAIKRNRKNRPDRAARRVSEPVAETAVVTAGADSVRQNDHHHQDHGRAEPEETTPAAIDPTPAPADSGPSGDSGSDGGTSTD